MSFRIGPTCRAPIGEKSRIDCHKGIAYHPPDRRGIPGWQ
jgi:nitrate/TMAO reductase-like tetraheme cytochrome c subunit